MVAVSRRFAWLILLLVTGLTVGCGQEPTRWDDAQQQTSGRQAPATSKESVAGSVFNQFFPSAEGDFKIVFKQEKTGFAQASLQQGGKEMATLSVSDTANNPSAAEKFEYPDREIAGYPAAAAGSKGLSVLVGDRFQVQIRSVDPAFGEAAREQWIQKFNLGGIAQIGT